MMSNDHRDDNDEDNNRVILHFDVDAMYVACERELNPGLCGVPVGVSQYNPYGDLEETAADQIERRLVVNSGTIQHNSDANGSLIAVSYEARAARVKRNDRGLEAIRKCPTISIVQVPVKRGKADLALYRSASARVMAVLTDAIREHASIGCTNVSMPVEIASIDEVYVDVTEAVNGMMANMDDENTVTATRWNEIVDSASQVTTVGGIETLSKASQAANALKKSEVRKGSRFQVAQHGAMMDEGSLSWWNRQPKDWDHGERQLAVAAFLAARGREAVINAFDSAFTLSGGISFNKTLAKLASGLKKPNQQTLVHHMSLQKLFHPLPLDRIRGLGGKLGVSIGEKLHVSTLGQLAQVSLSTLTETFPDDMARFLYDIGRGICRDPVTERNKPKSITCGKTFRGKLALPVFDTDNGVTSAKKLRSKWVHQLCGELTERVAADREQHGRSPKLICVNVQFSCSANNPKGSYLSKSCAVPRTLEGYPDACLELIQRLVVATPTSHQASSALLITGMVVGVSNFVEIAAGSSSIEAAFQRNNIKAENHSQIGMTWSSCTASPRKPSAMDQWLTKATINTEDSKDDSDTSGRKLPSLSPGAKKVAPFGCQAQKCGSIRRFLSNDTTTSTATASATATATEATTKGKRKLSMNVMLQQPPPGQDIDPDVWKELPVEVRATLLREIQPQKKARGITSFFGTSSSG